MTSRERLLATFRYQPTDRVPVRLWGVDTLVAPPRPSYRALWELADQQGIDMINHWGPVGTGHFYSAADEVSVSRFERPSEHDGFVESVTVMTTPAGDLTAVFLRSLEGKPGYQAKYLIDTLEAARRWLSIPTVLPAPPVDSFFETDRQLGGRGLLMAMIDHPLYAINQYIGSTVFAEWSIAERELVREMLDGMYVRIESYVKHLVANGVGPLFGYVGPELCIPPLQSPRDFREFVVDYDKRLTDLIHDAGGLVWVHCHGKVAGLLEDFVEMGVDCLNPVEPPPMGDVELPAAKRQVAGRMALEGNVEIGLFQTAAAEEFAAIVEQAVADGKPGGGFIFCPTSDHTHWIELDDQIMRNYKIFIETGLRLGRYE
jgi:hypothetical protein